MKKHEFLNFGSTDIFVTIIYIILECWFVMTKYSDPILANWC